MSQKSRKERLADLGWGLPIPILLLFLGALLKGEELHGLSATGKLRVILTAGVPLWLVLLLSIPAAYGLWSFRQSRRRPQLRMAGLSNHYYVGEKGPYCQPCYDKDKRFCFLSPRRSYGRRIGRRCDVCQNTFFEEVKQEQIPHVFQSSYVRRDDVWGR